jgi:hypothetical protein
MMSGNWRQRNKLGNGVHSHWKVRSETLKLSCWLLAAEMTGA